MNERMKASPKRKMYTRDKTMSRELAKWLSLEIISDDEEATGNTTPNSISDDLSGSEQIEELSAASCPSPCGNQDVRSDVSISSSTDESSPDSIFDTASVNSEDNSSMFSWVSFEDVSTVIPNCTTTLEVENKSQSKNQDILPTSDKEQTRTESTGTNIKSDVFFDDDIPTLEIEKKPNSEAPHILTTPESESINRSTVTTDLTETNITSEITSVKSDDNCMLPMVCTRDNYVSKDISKLFPELEDKNNQKSMEQCIPTTTNNEPTNSSQLRMDSPGNNILSTTDNEAINSSQLRTDSLETNINSESVSYTTDSKDRYITATFDSESVNSNNIPIVLTGSNSKTQSMSPVLNISSLGSENRPDSKDQHISPTLESDNISDLVIDLTGTSDSSNDCEQLNGKINSKFIPPLQTMDCEPAASVDSEDNSSMFSWVSFEDISTVIPNCTTTLEVENKSQSKNQDILPTSDKEQTRTESTGTNIKSDVFFDGDIPTLEIEKKPNSEAPHILTIPESESINRSTVTTDLTETNITSEITSVKSDDNCMLLMVCTRDNYVSKDISKLFPELEDKNNQKSMGQCIPTTTNNEPTNSSQLRMDSPGNNILSTTDNEPINSSQLRTDSLETNINSESVSYTTDSKDRYITATFDSESVNSNNIPIVLTGSNSKTQSMSPVLNISSLESENRPDSKDQHISPTLESDNISDLVIDLTGTSDSSNDCEQLNGKINSKFIPHLQTMDCEPVTSVKSDDNCMLPMVCTRDNYVSKDISKLFPELEDKNNQKSMEQCIPTTTNNEPTNSSQLRMDSPGNNILSTTDNEPINSSQLRTDSLETNINSESVSYTTDSKDRYITATFDSESVNSNNIPIVLTGSNSKTQSMSPVLNISSLESENRPDSKDQHISPTLESDNISDLVIDLTGTSDSSNDCEQLNGKINSKFIPPLQTMDCEPVTSVKSDDNCMLPMVCTRDNYVSKDISKLFPELEDKNNQKSMEQCIPTTTNNEPTNSSQLRMDSPGNNILSTTDNEPINSSQLRTDSLETNINSESVSYTTDSKDRYITATFDSESVNSNNIPIVLTGSNSKTQSMSPVLNISSLESENRPDSKDQHISPTLESDNISDLVIDLTGTSDSSNDCEQLNGKINSKFIPPLQTMDCEPVTSVKSDDNCMLPMVCTRDNYVSKDISKLFPELEDKNNQKSMEQCIPTTTNNEPTNSSQLRMDSPGNNILSTTDNEPINSSQLRTDSLETNINSESVSYTTDSKDRYITATFDSESVNSNNIPIVLTGSNSKTQSMSPVLNISSLESENRPDSKDQHISPTLESDNISDLVIDLTGTSDSSNDCEQLNGKINSKFIPPLQTMDCEPVTSVKSDDNCMLPMVCTRDNYVSKDISKLFPELEDKNNQKSMEQCIPTTTNNEPTNSSQLRMDSPGNNILSTTDNEPINSSQLRTDSLETNINSESVSYTTDSKDRYITATFDSESVNSNNIPIVLTGSNSKTQSMSPVLNISSLESENRPDSKDQHISPTLESDNISDLVIDLTGTSDSSNDCEQLNGKINSKFIPPLQTMDCEPVTSVKSDDNCMLPMVCTRDNYVSKDISKLFPELEDKNNQKSMEQCIPTTTNNEPTNSSQLRMDSPGNNILSTTDNEPINSSQLRTDSLETNINSESVSYTTDSKDRYITATFDSESVNSNNIPIVLTGSNSKTQSMSPVLNISSLESENRPDSKDQHISPTLESDNISDLVIDLTGTSDSSNDCEQLNGKINSKFIPPLQTMDCEPDADTMEVVESQQVAGSATSSQSSNIAVTLATSKQPKQITTKRKSTVERTYTTRSASKRPRRKSIATRCYQCDS